MLFRICGSSKRENATRLMSLVPHRFCEKGQSGSRVFSATLAAWRSGCCGYFLTTVSSSNVIVLTKLLDAKYLHQTACRYYILPVVKTALYWENSRDNVIGMVVRLLAGILTRSGLIPAVGKRSCLLQNVHTASRFHLAYCSMSTGSSFRENGGARVWR